MTTHRRIFLLLALTASSSCATAQDERLEVPPLILTGTQATFSIAHALIADTAIEVVNIPDDGREFTLLRPYLERRKDRFAMLFSQADAVISVTNALPADPLYRYARAANIRVVNIDAAVPWTYDTPGIALAEAPLSDASWDTSLQHDGDAATAPYFWLSISNAMRMADTVAQDFNALFPSFAPAITENLAHFRRSMLGMRNEYQARLIAAEEDTLYALTGDFVYLTNDLGLFVDGYFIRQDLDWTAEDLAALTSHLTARDIHVVIHKWLPDERIQDAIAAANAQLVVLETGDQGRQRDDLLAVDGLQQILMSNLEKLTAALSRQEEIQ